MYHTYLMQPSTVCPQHLLRICFISGCGQSDFRSMLWNWVCAWQLGSCVVGLYPWHPVGLACVPGRLSSFCLSWMMIAFLAVSMPASCFQLCTVWGWQPSWYRQTCWHHAVLLSCVYLPPNMLLPSLFSAFYLAANSHLGSFGNNDLKSSCLSGSSRAVRSGSCQPTVGAVPNAVDLAVIDTYDSKATSLMSLWYLESLKSPSEHKARGPRLMYSWSLHSEPCPEWK